MTTITKLLKEINLDSLNQVAELPFEQYLILAESHNMAWEDTQSLYNQAMDHQKKSRSALTHANQQIPKILKLNKSPASVSQYDKNFTKINHNYVVESSVASLYSPAAYLAELYRAARKLHKSNSVYSLDKRRPDLKSLTINQENMDKEVSTLSLVKKILWSKIEDKIKVIEDVAPEITLYQYLSTYKSTEAPYHHAYQSICQVLQERNINFHQLLNEPILTDRINKMPLFTISPGLYSILRQEVSDDIDKAMLLYKETGWSTDVIKSMVNGKEIDNSKFNPAMLEKILRVKHYQARYTISPDQALILANQFICYPNTNKEQFNKLFNNPPLNGVNFTTDSSFIINFNFNNEKNKFEDSTNTDVLKRAFRVNNSELMLMAMLASPSEDIKMIRNNSENISKLYRIRLLADVHHLTINELVMLLTILAPQSHPFIPTDSAALANLIDRVYSTTSWLDQQDWSVYELYCMTSKKYDTVRTPEIENLLNTLIAGLQNTQASEDTLKKAMAPLIASSLQLSSSTVAYQLLIWLDKLTEQSSNKSLLTVDAFWLKINRLKPEEGEDPEQTKIAINLFCQRLAQLTLICKCLQLSKPELSLVVNQPDLLKEGLKLVTPSVDNLKLLTRFHHWICSLGEQASAALTLLKDNTFLTISALAQAMSIEKNTLQRAVTSAKLELVAAPQAEESADPEAKFQDFATIDTLVQWLNISQRLGIDTDDLAKLLALTYDDGNYLAWQNCATALIAGLDATQASKVNAQLEAHLSAALSHNVMDHLIITSPNDLYQYLLIDNQVSAAVKTSIIAEAIAAIQLYINRALQLQEPDGLNPAVFNQPLFKNWEEYNKHYSTWAAAAKLVYQPENYIDPLHRIGQTKMMDNFLQAINQSQLSPSIIEDAFKAYLTEFEQIANLTTLSAYHDTLDNNTGFTYFIGHSHSDPDKYYWRRLDHRKSIKGKFLANAWSEWKKIDCVMMPANKLIQPVIYQSRFYLVWIEQQEKSEKGQKDKLEKQFIYQFKWAYHRYDGSWSSVFSYDVVTSQQELKKTLENSAFTCTEDNIKNTIAIYFYTKKTKEVVEKTAAENILRQSSRAEFLTKQEIICYSIADDMTCSFEIDKEFSPSFINVMKTFDTINYQDKNIRYPCPYSSYGSYKYEITDNENKTVDGHLKRSEDMNIVSYFGSDMNLFPICESYGTNGLKLFIQPYLSFYHSYFTADDNTSKIIDLMKKIGDVGKDRYLIYKINNKKEHDNKKMTLVVCLSQYKIGIHNPYESPNGQEIKLHFFGDNQPLFDPVIIVRGTNIFSLSDFKYQSEEAIGEQSEEDDINKFNLCKTLRIRKEDDDEFDFFETNNITACNTIEPMMKDLFISFGDKKVNISNASKELAADRMIIQPDKISYIIPNANFSNDIFTSTIQITFHQGKRFQHHPVTIKIKRTHNRLKIIHNEGIQCLKSDDNYYNEPLNTPFAKKLTARVNRGIDAVLSLSTQKHIERKMGNRAPVDFSGANALYFWELFYYLPMMVMQLSLQQNQFKQASKWLKYVYDPYGHATAESINHWKVLPLQETHPHQDRNLENSGSKDPDAIAQADPIHYRIATFMRQLDLLLARGDHAYRQLERDSLVEAKMYYIQALNLLGEEPKFEKDSTWTASTLDEITTEETPRPDEMPKEGAASSDNTHRFLPQENTQIKYYWQILNQRMFNLRHNLTLDGQLLSLPLYADPFDPKMLQSAALAISHTEQPFPTSAMSLNRFPQMLDRARGMVSQLIQFGSTLLSIIERQDAEALSVLLQTQAKALLTASIELQNHSQKELAAEQEALQYSLQGAQARLNHYHERFEENINQGEQQAIDLRASAATISTTVHAFYTAAALADMVPNIAGLAVGGMRWSALPTALAQSAELAASIQTIAADKILQSEMYRRRREEWQIQRQTAESEVNQLQAQLNALTIRRQSAELQKKYVQNEQANTEAHLAFLQRKFSNQALYNWLRGRLVSIYNQFYDQTLSLCLMSQQSWWWETHQSNKNFIKPGTWQSSYAGLLSGETLMLNLAEMESDYLTWESRALEVERTVSLAQVYKINFNLAEKITQFVTEEENTDHQTGSGENTLSFKAQTKTLEAKINLETLKIKEDYPDNLGTVRRIKQISVSLPMLLGPYQDIQATLSYVSAEQQKLAKVCTAIAISRGINDSGQFQLDFNDGKYLPFEGIAINDKGSLILSFPNATSKQKTLLQSLSDIILHIRYTIR